MDTLATLNGYTWVALITFISAFIAWFIVDYYENLSTVFVTVGLLTVSLICSIVGRAKKNMKGSGYLLTVFISIGSTLGLIGIPSLLWLASSLLQQW